MKNIVKIICTIVLLWAGFFTFTAYGGSNADPNKEALESLISELEQKIESADKRMVAHPNFLEELRSLVAKYKGMLRKVYFYEDFKDQNYTKNPKWMVKSGNFSISPASRLSSGVATAQPTQTQSSQPAQPFELIIKEILKKKPEKPEEKPTSATAVPAEIQTLAAIGPAFELELTFISTSTWGAMEIVLQGGKPSTAYYRLVYHAAPSPERPIQIIRQRDSKRYIIESASKFPVLDDGTPHQLQWIRDVNGTMRVLIDGMEVLNTVEVFYRSEFTGLVLINKGGTYEWGPIQITQGPAIK